MNARRLLVAIGTGAIALGLLVVVAPAFAGTFGTTTSSLFLVGGLAAFLALRAVRQRRSASVERATLPEVESELAFDRPGNQFTDRVDRVRNSRRGEGRSHVRDLLERATVDVLTSYRDYTEAEAEAAIANGTWTDDPYAAVFFTRGTPTVPLRKRLRDALGGRMAFERRTDHVIAELDDITGDS